MYLPYALEFDFVFLFLAFDLSGVAYPLRFLQISAKYPPQICCICDYTFQLNSALKDRGFQIERCGEERCACAHREWDENSGAMFFQQEKRRAGAQTNFCCDKNLVEGEIPTRGAKLIQFDYER